MVKGSAPNLFALLVFFLQYPTLVLCLCDSSCLTCSGPSANQCTSCASTAMLLSGTCQCPNGTYSSGTGVTVCLACSSSCSTCTGPSSSNCVTCPSGYFVYQGTCYQNCASSQYFNTSTLTCKACDPNCLTCNGPTSTSCTSCSSGTLTSGSCQCTSTQYKDASYTCQNCDTTCKTCTNGSSSGCSSCYSSMTLQSGQCQCPTMTYWDSGSLGCPSCDSRCQTCTGSGSTQCSSCRNNLSLSSGQCICGGNTYYDTTSVACLSCYSMCQTCSGASSTQCTSCPNNLALSGGSCVCSSGTYYNAASVSCLSCDSTCAQCSGSLSTQCASCPNNLTLSGGSCICSSGTYYDSASVSCLGCDSTCAQCTGSLNTQCTSCPNNLTISNGQCICTAGTYYDSASLSCLSCDSTCAQCSGSLSTQCTSCPNNLMLSGGSCICSAGTYYDSTSVSCLSCDSTCAQCTGSLSTQCTSCPNNLTLSSGQCICAAGTYYSSASVVCLSCYSRCQTCSGSSNTQCTSCPNNLMLSGGSCVCSSGTYYDSASVSCPSCDSTCAQCSGSLSAQCTSCPNNLTLSGGSCICSSGTYYDSASVSCLGCDSTCAQCTGSLNTQCTSCPNNLTISNGQCICTAGTYYDSASLSCLSCDSTCAQCSGSLSTQCTSCPNNLTFSGGSCICSSGTYYDSASVSCLSCASTCAQCTGSLNTQCTSCPNNLTISSGQCICTAGTYYDSASLSCLSCDSTCAQCSESLSTQCTSCPNNLTFSGGSCICSSGTYYDSTSVSCLNCDSTCAQCTGSLSTQCTSCPNNLTLSSGQCICAAGTYYSSTSVACLSCYSRCQTCSGPSNAQCNSCPNNLMLSGGSCVCSSGTYYDSASVSCPSCDSTCAQCSGSLSTQCTSCPNNLILSAFNQCFCQDGTYLNSTLMLCSACHSSCSTCSGPSLSECTACDSSSGTSLSNGQCIKKTCYSSCSTCQGSTKYECSSCESGYALLLATNTVGSCITQCPSGYYLTTSNSQKICQLKTAINNQLVYGSAVTQFKISMLGYTHFDFDALISSINVSLAYVSQQPSIQYTYSFTLASDSTYILLSLAYSSHLLPGSILSLAFDTFLQDTTIPYYLLHDSQSIQLGEYYEYSAALQNLIQSSSQVSTISTKTNGAFSLGSSLLVTSVHSMRSQVVEDIMSYFMYMNIRFPPNLLTFQNSSGQSSFASLTPNFVNSIINKISIKSGEVSQSLAETEAANVDMGYSLNQYATERSFLQNFGATLSSFVVAFLVIGLLETVRRFGIQKDVVTRSIIKAKIKKFLDMMSYSLRWNFMINQYIAAYIDLVFNSLLQINNRLSNKNFLGYFDYLLAALSFILSLVGILSAFIIGRNLFFVLKNEDYESDKLTHKKKKLTKDDENKEGEEGLKRLEVLHSAFRHEQRQQLLYPYFMILRTFGFIITIILLEKVPILQALYIIVANILVIIYLVRYKPMESGLQAILTITYEALFLMASLATLTLHLYNIKHLADIETRSVLGFIVIGCSLLMSVLDFVSMFVELVKFIYGLRRSKKVTCDLPVCKSNAMIKDISSDKPLNAYFGEGNVRRITKKGLTLLSPNKYIKDDETAVTRELTIESNKFSVKSKQTFDEEHHLEEILPSHSKSTKAKISRFKIMNDAIVESSSPIFVYNNFKSGEFPIKKGSIDTLDIQSNATNSKGIDNLNIVNKISSIKDDNVDVSNHGLHNISANPKDEEFVFEDIDIIKLDNKKHIIDRKRPFSRAHPTHAIRQSSFKNKSRDSISVLFEGIKADREISFNEGMPSKNTILDIFENKLQMIGDKSDMPSNTDRERSSFNAAGQSRASFNNFQLASTSRQSRRPLFNRRLPSITLEEDPRNDNSK